MDQPATIVPDSSPNIAVRERSLAGTGVFLLLLIAALQFASSLLLPIAFSMLFMFLLGPLVRYLASKGLPEAIAAALVVFGTVGVLGGGAYLLSGPRRSGCRARRPRSRSGGNAAPQTHSAVERPPEDRRAYRRRDEPG